MSIMWFRDLALVILGFGATVVLIFLAVLAYLIYRQLGPMLESSKVAMARLENLTSSVEEEVVRPLAQVAAFVQGIRQAVSLVRRFTQKREEKKG